MARAVSQVTKLLRPINIAHNICMRRFKCTESANARGRYISALYIPGNRATETFSYFSPYLDFDEKFEDLPRMQDDLLKRGIDINLADLKTAWGMFKTVTLKKAQLESNIKRIGHELSTMSLLKDSNDGKSEEAEALRIQLKLLKNDCKTLSDTLWEMEEDIVVRCLMLPNKLHKRTPAKEPVILETFGEVTSLKSCKKSHIEIGINLGLLEYINNYHYFLLGEAASFEQGVLNLAGHILKGNHFIRVSGLDFSRSSVVEGSGLDHQNPYSAFLLKNVNDDKNLLNPLHLVGNSSLLSFLTLNTKVKYNPNDFPLYYFSTGRQYTPEFHGNESEGLFGVCQESVVQVFGLAKDEAQYESLFDTIMGTVKQLCGELCDHYRIVIKPAEELTFSESLHASIEAWSNFKERYVEIGYVSMHEDYLSKRLLTVYQTPDGRDYPYIISATLSVPKLLACTIEKDSEVFQMPEMVKRYISTRSETS